MHRGVLCRGGLCTWCAGLPCPRLILSASQDRPSSHPVPFHHITAEYASVEQSSPENAVSTGTVHGSRYHSCTHPGSACGLLFWLCCSCRKWTTSVCTRTHARSTTVCKMEYVLYEHSTGDRNIDRPKEGCSDVVRFASRIRL